MSEQLKELIGGEGTAVLNSQSYLIAWSLQRFKVTITGEKCTQLFLFALKKTPLCYEVA